MKKIIAILTILSLVVLTGCGKVHDPSPTTETESTEMVFEDAVVTTTNGDVDASLIKTEQSENGYVYTVFVNSNDTYATLKPDCVKYLEDTYVNISEVMPEVATQVWNINGGSTKDVTAFVRISSPTILDLKKVFISVFGTTEYQEGMTFESVEQYKETYGTDTLVSMYIQVTENSFNAEALYAATRPIYESVRLVNLGNGYDVVHISTNNTKAYEEDGILWTPVVITNLTGEDYSEIFEDMLNNTYVAQGNSRGTYGDITIMHNSPHKTAVRISEGVVEVGITNYIAGESTVNCVIGNIVVGEDVEHLSDEIARTAIIIFFND